MEWMNKTQEFIDRAFSGPPNEGVKCPCSRCRNALRQDKGKLTLHIYKFGFMPGYEVWTHHGETVHQRTASVAEEELIGAVMIGWMRCLMLYGRNLKQTIRIILHRRCKSFSTCLELQKSRCMNTRQ
jgi:hypothetical protein